MKKHVLALLATALAVACSSQEDDETKIAQRLVFKPDHDFSPDLAPPAPDYRLPDAWAALPERKDNADQTPEGIADNQAEAAADVFFIHPTTYFKKDGWNAPYENSGEGRMSVEEGTLRGQASVFNGCCRVFAPRYRQATLYTFLAFNENSEHALDLAYQDIAAAFDNFIREKNDGRPFIIASHSQGSYHAMRLLEERVLGTDLMDRLVAVYAVGGPVPEAFAPDRLPPCDDARQTRCIIGWNTVSKKNEPDLRRDERALIWLDGGYRPVAGRPLLCVNPLNWKAGGTAPASDNLGALSGNQDPGALSALLPRLTGAGCENGYLVIDFNEDIDGFKSRQTKNGSYHVFDYNLFYMNIRTNAADRVDAFLEEQ
ncbi:DUF3089 domain-containing protein [Hyphococcus luteus]|uniref:DUF3089 domain-containing protein n=1 Tax=Hyphococcus luteus TaxID=2058213 RepID=A0A2S7K3Q9_9PROT|nr:DUF3089 domain-containing protein [Marinicaulis flavus]PQA87127.1 hypothetical protein CW354_13885 [Marinicaulis flavus]